MTWITSAQFLPHKHNGCHTKHRGVGNKALPPRTRLFYPEVRRFELRIKEDIEDEGRTLRSKRGSCDGRRTSSLHDSEGCHSCCRPREWGPGRCVRGWERAGHRLPNRPGSQTNPGPLPAPSLANAKLPRWLLNLPETHVPHSEQYFSS